jgi:lathosterol oxidase
MKTAVKDSKDSADYMSTYMPEGEETERMSLIESLGTFIFIMLTGFAGRGDLLMHIVLLIRSSGFDIIDISYVREILRGSKLACALILTVPAIFSSALYYNHCAKMEATYYTRPKSESSKWKIQADKWLSPKLHREEVILGCFNAALGAVLANCLALAYLLEGHTALYMQVEDHGWCWFAASFPIIFFWIEIWAYSSHRFWHIKFLYAHFHKVHHRYQPPTAFSAVAFHPLEFAIYVVGGQTLFWFVPLHPIPAAIVGAYTAYYLIDDHSGIKRTPFWPWQPTSKYHDDHHRYFHCNFGQHILLFDQICGTIRQETREYSEEIFGGKGKRE